MSYRVLGSPYALSLHQHVTYLRLRRLPFKVYCRTLTTTLFYALLFRARNAFCTVAPDGNSYLQVWQLMHAVEHNIKNSKEEDGGNNFLLSKQTHPDLHLASWVIFLYSSWWLAKTGAVFRWVDGGDNVDVIDGYLRYFLLIPGIGFPRVIVKKFRSAMRQLTSITGVSQETAPYMREHFYEFCGSLDKHFQKNPEFLFILGTPHPTIADVAIGACFSANFLIDDPPASLIVQKFAYLHAYIERITGWREGEGDGDDMYSEGKKEADNNNNKDNNNNNNNNNSNNKDNNNNNKDNNNNSKDKDKIECKLSSSSSAHYADSVPESLSPLFALIRDVMPFMASQCAAFHAYMSGDGVRRLRREALANEWCGCRGYITPQMTEVKSLMIIDSGIYTVRARAQDLEAALLAAREVTAGDHEEEEYNHSSGDEQGRRLTMDLNFREDGGGGGVTTQPAAAGTAEEEGESAKTHTSGGGATVKEDNIITTTNNIININNNISININNNDMSADDADFHRVFTSSAKHGRNIHHSRLTTAQLGGRVPVKTHLAALKEMLRKMHHPHYTLRSVFHGRKMFVAIIPECEVARKRREMKEE